MNPPIRDIYDALPPERGTALRRANLERLAELEADGPERQSPDGGRRRRAYAPGRTCDLTPRPSRTFARASANPSSGKSWVSIDLASIAPAAISSSAGP